MGYEKIPADLTALKRWVVARSVNDKPPLVAGSLRAASVSDPTTWSSFDEAVSCASINGFQIGFVLGDGIAGIDLDLPLTPEQAQRHSKICSLVDSYQEISCSGNGVHLLVKGSVPSGVRKDQVEVYSEGRYFIVTGNVLKDTPISDCQEFLTTMWNEMSEKNGAIELVEYPSKLSDNEILQMAFQASNAEKFGRLWNGDWTKYPSQSEADHALLSILCFYSCSNEQVRRIFRMSALGQREKTSKKDYHINKALGKIRGRQEAETLPQVDISALLAKYADPVPELAADFVPNPVPNPPHLLNGHANGSVSTIEVVPILEPSPRCATFPPGLIGEMADYIYSSAIRPIPEVGLTMALAMGSGFLGRQFQISNTGFNQYIILVGRSGVGKEGGVDGVETLLGKIRPQFPQVDAFVGPASFASGQAFIRALDKSNNFFSIFGEIGITLRQICDKRASSHEEQFKKVLLDLFGKSGASKHVRPSAYSDKDKNTGLVKAPCVSFWGDTTPDIFYSTLDAEQLAQGLITRLSIFEYKGKRPVKNLNAFHAPSENLVRQLVQAFQVVMAMKFGDQFVSVKMDASAKKLMDEFNEYADNKINDDDQELPRQIWARADLKCLKLAGLVATGCNIHDPIVTKEIAEWAIATVSTDVGNMATKFTSGEMGTGDHQCEADIRRAVEKYPSMTAKQRAAYNVPERLRDPSLLPKAVPYVFLKKYCYMRSAFKNHPRGAVTAMDITLRDIVKSGILQLIPAPEVKLLTGTDSPLYYRGESWGN